MIGGELLLALAGASVVGISLGLLGSGGSILTVPLLVYVVHHDEKAAIAESLAIVGVISLFGVAARLGRGDLHWQAILLFGPASMLGAWAGAFAAQWVAGSIQLLILGGIMVAAAWLMLRRPEAEGTDARARHPASLAAAGLGVGGLTGLVGIGGGFLIVPALVIAGGLAIRRAVATSLALITLNCVIGFLTYWRILASSRGPRIDPTTIAVFGILGVAGAGVGQYLGARISQQVFRRVFAVFVVGMGIWIIVREMGALRTA